MANPADTPANEKPADVTLQWVTFGEEPKTHRRLVGDILGRRYSFFHDWTGRVRWSLVDYPGDDGPSIATHGAEHGLGLAIEAAWRNSEERNVHQS